MVIKRKNKLNLKVSTRELIIDEAERIIAHRGLEGLKLDDIAEILGVKRPSLYTHFNGRDGILAAVAERTFRLFSEQFPDDGGEDPAATLSEGVRRMVAFLSEHKAYACLMARDFATPTGLPAVNTVLEPADEASRPRILQPLYQRLEAILERGYTMGKFEKTDAYLFLTTVAGAIMCNLLQHHRKAVTDLDKRMVKLALGIVSVPAA